MIFAAKPRSTVQIEGDGVVVDTGLGLVAQAGALRDEVYELAGNGDFALWLFAERDADGVTNAFSEQGSDAYSRLDAAVLTLASLCDAEVQGIVHILLVHRTTSSKCSRRKMRRNSMQLSTMPSGVSP